MWSVGTNIFTGIPCLLQWSMTNLVPREEPSQKARTRSADLIMEIFRFNGADLPYLLYSGKYSVSFISWDSAYSRAQQSIPLAPPDTISVTPSGRYFSKSVTHNPLEPTMATTIFLPHLHRKSQFPTNIQWKHAFFLIIKSANESYYLGI